MRVETRRLLPPPHSADSERAVLGSMLAFPEVVPMAVSVLVDGDFFVPHYRAFFEAMKTLHDNKLPIDSVTVLEQLKRHSDLQEQEAAGVSAEIMTSFGTKSGVETYARTVRDYAQRRQLLEVLRRTGQQVAEGEVNLAAIIDMQKEMLRVIEMRQDDAKFSTSKLALEQFYDELARRAACPDRFLGLPLGWNIVDDWTGGMFPGEVFTVGALGGVGKTVVMVNTARSLTEGQRYDYAQGKWIECRRRRAGIFSTEMSRIQLMMRLISDVADVPSEKFRKTISPYDLERIANYTEHVKEWPLIIDDTKGLTRSEFRKRARQAVRNDGAEIIMLDYIQNLKKDNPREDAFTHIEACSSMTDELAEELGVPILQLAQLNWRKVQGSGGEPNKGSFEGGDCIYQDSDTVIFLHCPHKEGVKYQDSHGRYDYTWIVDKNRSGRTGRIKMLFEAKYVRFLEAPDQGFSTKPK